MKSLRLDRLQHCRRLREQKSISNLETRRAIFRETEAAFLTAYEALEHNREERRQREQQIYRNLRQRTVRAHQMEMLRWELIELEMETETLRQALDDTRADLEVAMAGVEEARKTYLAHWRASQKWQQVVQHVRADEESSSNRLAEFEQDDIRIDRAGRHS